MVAADQRAALARFNAGIARARHAYHHEATCPRCGSLVDRHPNRLPVLCAGCRKDA